MSDFSYMLPGMLSGTVRALISCAFFLGLAVFIFMQKAHAPALRRFTLVAAGLAVFGAFPVLTIPLDLLLGFIGYGGLPYTLVSWLAQAVGGIGYFLGTGLVVVGMTLVAKDLALGVEDQAIVDET